MTGVERSGAGYVEGALALLVYALAALAWLWPLPPSAFDHLAYVESGPLAHADLDLGVWSVAWVTHALGSEPWRLFDANSFYPAPFSLAYSEHYLGHVPTFAPVYLVSGNPILAVNVSIAAMYALSALGLYVLARHWVSPPAAFLGGLLYAFHPMRLEYQNHYYLLATGYLPLAIHFAERVLERGRWRDAAGLGVTLGLQLLCSFYLAFGAALACGLYLALAVVRARRTLDASRILRLVGGLALAAVPFVASAWPYLQLRHWGLIPDYGGPADVPGLLPTVTRDRVHAFLLGGGVGTVGMLLAAMAVVPPWRDRRWPTVVGLSLVALGVVLGFGPQIAVGSSRLPTPYALLQAWLPGFSAVRSSTRLLFVAELGLALLVALGLQRIVVRHGGALAWTASLAAALLCHATFPPLPRATLHERPVGGAVPPAYRWLAAHGGGRPLLELPPGNFERNARRMYLSHVHWLPLLQGYSAYAPASWRYLQRLASGLPSPASLERLTAAVDVGWILVHLRELGPRAERWRGPLPEGLRRAGTFGDDLVVEVMRAGAADPRARLFDPERTVGGVPLAAVGPDCPGRIRLARPLPTTVAPGAAVHVEVVVENRGDRPWPGLAFVPSHAVGLVACFAAPPRSCSASAKSLYADVPAGGSVVAGALLRSPPYPGEYELQVRLEQPADGGLDRCGVAPLVVPVRVGARPPESSAGFRSRRRASGRRRLSCSPHAQEVRVDESALDSLGHSLRPFGIPMDAVVRVAVGAVEIPVHPVVEVDELQR